MSALTLTDATRPGRLLPFDAVALWMLSVVAAAAVGTHGIIYWDAGDYVRLAVDGGPSGLLLGRPLFLLASRLVLSVGVDPSSAEPVLRWFWTCVGATAAPAIAILFARLGLTRAEALVVGLALALSPSFAHTDHQVLTDTPALALSLVALILAERSQAVLAGVLLAAAVTTRETTAIHAIAIAMLLGRRGGIIALAVAAAGTALTLWIFPPPALAHWFEAMTKSSERHPLTVKSIAISIGWLFAAGPLPVLAGIWLILKRPSARWMIVSVPAALASIALIFYPDGAFSPRYLLATVPTAFFPPAASWLVARPRLLAAGLLIPLAIVPFVTRSARAVSAHGAAIMERVPQLPIGSFVVPGHYCPEARLGASLHGRRDIEMMCPGWAWPEDPAATLDAALATGRPVAVDLAIDAWWGEREWPYRDALHAWAAGRTGENIAGFLVLRR